MSSFQRGFRNTSPLVLVVALVLLVPALLGIEWFFTSGAWSTVSMDHWIRNQNDDYMAVSWRTSRLKYDPPDLPLVALLDGSSGRECIVSGSSLAAEVAADGGPQIAAYNLSSRMQRYAQSWAIVDNLPNTPTTVLIGVNLGRFTTSPRSNYAQVIGRELVLKSDSLRRYVVDVSGEHRHSYTILPGIFSSLATYLQQRERDILVRGRLHKKPYREHQFDRRKPLSTADKEALVDKWLTDYKPAFDKVLDFNLDMLEHLVRRAQARGMAVVIVELPWNEEIIGDRFRASMAKYREPTREIAARYDVPYLDFNDKVDIPSEDFLDLSHLLPAGRKIWQAELARQLARLYSQGVLPVNKT